MSELVTDPNDPRLGHGVDDKPGQQNKAYLVLSEAERAKGFIRPLRDAYIHVGLAAKYPLRDLTDEEKERYKGQNYVKFEPYPEDRSPVLGKYWTQEQLNNTGCQGKTTMALALAETYARNPDFYSATYCVHCHRHLPVEEFTWLDGQVVGS